MSGQHRAAMAPQHLNRRREDFRAWVMPYLIVVAIVALLGFATLIDAIIR